MGFVFTDPAALVPFAKLRARRGICDGRETPANRHLIMQCRHLLQLSPEHIACVIFTREHGYHSGGWWKNPDYERCWHLSLSFAAEPGMAPLPYDRKAGEQLARAFFGDDARLLWIEGPATPEGRARHVWHYRLFCDPAWAPLKPRGEVYSRDWTPADWQSFSDVHAAAPAS